jgi:hypothetical protein
MQMLTQLATLLQPWQTAYSDSRVISTAVTGAHVLSLFLGGGLAVAADRTSLRAAGRSPEERLLFLREQRGVHRPVVAALAVLLLSGVLLAAADVETFAASPVFWIKMALVALLLVNGAVMVRMEGRLLAASDAGAADDVERGWGRMRTAAVLSLLLWTLTAVAGQVLTAIA